MSGLFGAIGITGSGIDAAQTWINTNAGNLANMNDTVSTAQGAYQQQTPVFTPLVGPTGQGDGVAVSSVQLGSAIGRLVYDPTNPQANAQGMVRQPAISMSTQLVQLVQAQNDYQANTVAFKRALTAYQSALTLGS
ncbi:MAG: flagellar basal-body rod protein FlgC [Actinomycetota bacterium]|nr:flagellar basal-body rod protein FlgC [Actinomycetota bacterium]